jgi:hypothetical protein
MKTIVILTALLLLLPATGPGQSKTGTSAAQFLLIEPSAKIAAMGNAGSTIADELQAAYYNPAAIGRFASSGIQATHSTWIADINFDYVAAGLVLGEFGNLYASVTSLNSGEIDVRTVEEPLGTGERYTVSDLAVGVGYGRQISERFSVGLQASYFQESIWHSSMGAFFLNVGTLYRISENGLHVGASISNFGTRAKFDGSDLRIMFDQNPDVYGDNGNLPAELRTDDFPLPILFRVGVGLPLRIDDENSFRVAVDAFHPSDNTESISMGAEWGYHDVLFLRGGYQNLFEQDAETGLTLGAGVRYDTGEIGLSFDYAWADHGRLSTTHRFALGVAF